MTERDLDMMCVAVDKGVELLDEAVPDWYNIINIDDIIMEDADYCICGQLFVDKISGTYRTGYSWALHNFIPKSRSREYGFDVPNIPLGPNYEQLAIEWINRIEKKRAEAGTMLT